MQLGTQNDAFLIHSQDVADILGYRHYDDLFDSFGELISDMYHGGASVHATVLVCEEQMANDYERLRQ